MNKFFLVINSLHSIEFYLELSKIRVFVVSFN
jgi:hypothetical protein